MKNIILKYECMNQYQNILNKYNDDKELYIFLKDMYDLVLYQMEQIKNQRILLIAQEHKESWKQYDKIEKL